MSTYLLTVSAPGAVLTDKSPWTDCGSLAPSWPRARPSSSPWLRTLNILSSKGSRSWSWSWARIWNKTWNLDNDVPRNIHTVDSWSWIIEYIMHTPGDKKCENFSDNEMAWDKFRVDNIEGKGQGCVAIQALTRGTIKLRLCSGWIVCHLSSICF